MSLKDKSRIPYSLLELLGVFLLPFAIHILFTGGIEPLYGGDMATQFTVYLGILRKALLEGRFPFWEHFWAGGYPFGADPQTLCYYPPAMAATVLFPPLWAGTILVLFHLGLGALGTWLFSRRISGIRSGAWISALMYSLGGYVSGHLMHVSFVHVLGLFPMILYVLFLPERKHLFGFSTILSAVLFALIFTAGHPQSALMATAMILFLLVYLGNKTTIVRGGIALALGICLASPALLSYRELMMNSVRSQFGYAQFTEGGLPPVQLVQFISPLFFGGGKGIISASNYWGELFIHETIAFVGLCPLVLGITACILGVARKTPWRRPAWAFSLLVLAGIVLACSRALHLAELLYHVPVVKLFRVHSRYLLASVTGLHFLAAMGLAGILGKWPGWEAGGARRVCFGIAIAVCVFFILFCAWSMFFPEGFPRAGESHGKIKGIVDLLTRMYQSVKYAVLFLILVLFLFWKQRSAREVIWGVLAISVLDLGLVKYEMYPIFTPKPESLSRVLKDMCTGPGWTLVEYPHHLPIEMKILYPNRPLEEGLKVLNQYNPLILESFSRSLSLNHLGQMQEPGKVITHKGLCSAFGIRRIVLSRMYEWGPKRQRLFLKRPKPGLRAVPLPDILGLFTKMCEYKNFWMGKGGNGQDPALAYIPENIISGPMEALFDRNTPFPFRSAEEFSMVHDAKTVTIRKNRTGRVIRERIGSSLAEAEIDAEEDAVIVFRLMDYPGWRLLIDGKPYSYFRTNGCFVGAKAQPGRHIYLWKFRPTHLGKGIGISLAGILLMIIGVMLERKRSPSKDSGGREARGQRDKWTRG